MFSASADSPAGLLPAYPALQCLPASHAPLEALVSRLPALLRGSDAAALAAAVSALPLLPLPADDTDSVLLHALHRDYAFVASAFVLEPRHRRLGAPRASLPAQLAVPLWGVAHRLGLPPLLEYTAYALGNWRPVNAAAPPPLGSPLSWRDARLIRCFDGGGEEATFVLVHIDIESQTRTLVSATHAALASVSMPEVAGLTDALLRVAGALDGIIVSSLKMFNASDPDLYEKLVRPWIFGWRNDVELPEGVTFEGVVLDAAAPPSPWAADTAAPVRTFLRGETGAQSSIVPSMDALLGITHKHDALRVMLAELEHYRPPAHKAHLEAIREACWGHRHGPPADAAVAGHVEARRPGARPGSYGAPPTDAAAPSAEPHPHAVRAAVRASGDRATVLAFNACCEAVWAFRAVHTAYADLYIGRVTTCEIATGGTPYKPYLLKHRDESAPSATQILDGPGGAADVVELLPRTPAGDEYDAQLAATLTAHNGIPAYLLARHAGIIARLGGGDPSLSRKLYPSREWAAGGTHLP